MGQGATKEIQSLKTQLLESQQKANDLNEGNESLTEQLCEASKEMTKLNEANQNLRTELGEASRKVDYAKDESQRQKAEFEKQQSDLKIQTRGEVETDVDETVIFTRQSVHDLGRDKAHSVIADSSGILSGYLIARKDVFLRQKHWGLFKDIDSITVAKSGFKILQRGTFIPEENVDPSIRKLWQKGDDPRLCPACRLSFFMAPDSLDKVVAFVKGEDGISFEKQSLIQTVRLSAALFDQFETSDLE